MAECKGSTERTELELARAGIRVKQTPNGIIYAGTRDAIIAAGLVSAEQIPGEPTCPNRKMPFRFERDGREFLVHSSRRKGTVEVRAMPTREEEEAHWALRAAQVEARRVAEEARKELAWLPRSREQYRERVGRSVLTRSAREREFLLEPWGGYSLPEHAVNEFEQAVDMALHELLEHVRFSRAARDREIAAWRQKAADADPDFARFMQTTTEGANQ
jgi:hypothetical protein